jgi:zinc/manganese transport system substrate-binding protein
VTWDRNRGASWPAAVALSLVTAVGLASCATGSPSVPGVGTASGGPAGGRQGTSSPGRVIEVAAAENFWGSIAAQVGGIHARVVSIITNPNTDPHSYEPTAADARTVAASQLVIENGIGYDPWVEKLLSADGTSMVTLDVGTVLGVPDGSNPHRWYNPSDVQSVIKELVADYHKIDPKDSSYFARQASHFDTVGLKRYDATIAAIKARYSGTPVGASESIFAMLAPALGLKLITPPSFLRAISEGTDVSVADKETIDDQIRAHLIKIYVYNSQNVTPDVQAQLQEAKSNHIPVATITETLQPATASYQVWQTRQLVGIEKALARSRD